jgi:hypothetical protein
MKYENDPTNVKHINELAKHAYAPEKKDESLLFFSMRQLKTM